MIHMVFMKFENGFFDPAVTAQIAAAFGELQKELPEQILSVKVRENCVSREANMDLLIQMELSGEDALDVYLAHPVHRAIGEVMNPHIVNRCSFDFHSTHRPREM